MEIPGCPHLPPSVPEMSYRDLRELGADRGPDFYRVALTYGQCLWQRGLPAQAILQLDRAWGAELRGDPKERAEHDMLVDLARNDLGRVAKIGSVTVKEHATLEKFQRVQHLVSRVECDLANGRDALDALSAAFPAGTVSGAPKVRAMQLLSELESSSRGPYAGCFGYLDGRGNLDMAITIRTLTVEDNTIGVQAGAGIVFDSDPEKEYQETLHKARALFDAVQLADSPTFKPSARAEAHS